MNTKSTYKCDKCQDTGYILSKREGTVVETATPCECQIPKTIERYLDNSGISVDEYNSKTLDTFQTGTDMAKRMKSIAEKFIADIHTANGCGYFGNSGTGKTHICIAICQELTRKHVRPHKYFSYRTEVQRLKALYYKPEFTNEISKIISEPLLYIDDFLKLANRTDGKTDSQELQISYEIVNGRYLNKAKTIFSSEYTVSDMRIIDEALASRVYEIVGEYGMKCDGRNERFV